MNIRVVKNESRVVPLKTTINTVLPIALAVLLPGLSLYSNIEAEYLNSKLNFLVSWFVSGMVMYLLWYILWFLWDIKANPSRWRLILLLTVVLAMIIAFLTFYARSQEITLRGIYLVRAILGVILFLAIQYALKTQDNISKLLLEKEQIQTDNYRVQLQALQRQVDPHFLFNSLNTLRSMVRQHHSNSEKFIMSLSDFYRQTLKHNENTTLPLAEELAVLESYLFLMKSRNEEAIKVKLNIDPSLHKKHIPTLALQIVVENCFKHNSMTSKRPLRIEISSTADFCIEVKNNLQPKIGDQQPSGYGLNSLQKRFELMDIHQGLLIHESDDQFSVKLKLI